MSFLFGKAPSVPAAPAVPDASAPQVAEARDRQRQMVAAMAGNKANWLTGPTGLTGPAPVAQKMLFGS